MPAEYQPITAGRKRYPFLQIETKWQARWAAQRPADSNIATIAGCGGPGIRGVAPLHVGQLRGAVAADVLRRFAGKLGVSAPAGGYAIPEPGVILGEDGQGMGRRRGDVIRPGEVIAEFGADSLRLYEMFIGPIGQCRPWITKGVEGMHRFLSHLWVLIVGAGCGRSLAPSIVDIEPTRRQQKVLHETIRRVTADTAAFRFDAAILQMMICVHGFSRAGEHSASGLATFLHLLNPYAPHLSEELNEQLAARFDRVPDLPLAAQPWPACDEAMLAEFEIDMAVHVNGRACSRVTVATTDSEESIREQALAATGVLSCLAGRRVRRAIVVPGRLINLVAE